MRRLLGSVGALVVGIVLGAVLTFSIQSKGLTPVQRGRPAPRPPALTPEAPTTYLAWVPGGLPTGFGERVARLRGIVEVTTVAEDDVWLHRSWSGSGVEVDRPRAPFDIPIDAAAVRPASFARVLPPVDRDLAASLARGQGVLGASSAELRGLGPGAVMEFSTGVRVRIAAVLPDELVGAAELMVSRSTGARIGVRKDRYVLLRVKPSMRETSKGLARRLRHLLPQNLGVDRKVQVRAPGETPYFRAGDAVLPPVLLKALFGEFAARPAPGRPGYLKIQPSWIRAHIVTATVPLLGGVTCSRAIIPQLRGAMTELRRRGRGSLVHSYDGCFAPKYVNRDPTAMISHHAWGVAIDLNAATNPFGAAPHQDPRLVRVMERWGFLWGGTFLVPDGNHFEYRRAPMAA